MPEIFSEKWQYYENDCKFLNLFNFRKIIRKMRITQSCAFTSNKCYNFFTYYVRDALISSITLRSF